MTRATRLLKSNAAAHARITAQVAAVKSCPLTHRATVNVKAGWPVRTKYSCK